MTPHPPQRIHRRWTGAIRLVAVGLAGLVCGLLVSASRADPPDPRYADRRSVAVPPASVVPEVARRGTTSFSAEVDAIVANLDLATYDTFLRGLTGWNPVTVGGSSVTLQTRYSTTPAGQICWQYAYETFEALGYDVRYQHYSRSGHALKNIIATIEGRSTPEKIYVLGAHIDATSPNPTVSAPGAEDNGSGSAAVLAAAAALVGQQFDSTIELILFSGEEQGLWGSDAYVTEALAMNRDVRSAVTLDMIAAWSDDYGVLIEGETAWQPLMFLMADAVDAYTEISRSFSYFSFGSDHVPFQNAGIPAILGIDLDWGSYPYYHKTTDTYNRTTPALGLEITRAGLASIAHLAGALGSAVGAPNLAELPDRGAFPNPTSTEVTVSFAVRSPREAAASVTVFDVSGRKLTTIPTTPNDAGESTRTSATWNLRDASGRAVRPGVYWLRYGSTSRKVVVAP